MRCWLLVACALAACAIDEIATATQPITNGAPATGDPAVIALVDERDRVGCTAAVIGPHTAITASHCIAAADPRTLRAVFGTSVASGTMIAVSDGRMHPMFDATTLANDVAMLTLRDEAPVPPLALDTRTIDAALVGTTFRVVGWGTTGGGVGDSGDKREGTARISEVSATELTAVPDPSQPCRGDSGGPALLSTDAVAAVVSRGDIGCTDHATYARIDAARAVLVDPYLADTAPGTAQIGDACLYEGQCAEGACVQSEDDPLAYVCEPDDGGCGCASGAPPPLWLVVLLLLTTARSCRSRAARSS
jgi:secreted trypsin-like serine protease